MRRKKKTKRKKREKKTKRKKMKKRTKEKSKEAFQYVSTAQFSQVDSQYLGAVQGGGGCDRASVASLAIIRDLP